MDKIVIGQDLDLRGQYISAGIKAGDRRHHCYMVGKTGTGKTTLLKNMIIQDIRAGRGVCLIDPHGDLVGDILSYIPKSRTNDVVYFDPADTERVAGLNVLEAQDENAKQLVASTLVSVFRHLFKDFWGPRTEHLFYNSIFALLETPGNTLLGVYRLLLDQDFREKIVGQVRDPIVKMFWTEDFANYQERFIKEIISPLQNKLSQLLTSPILRNIVGQTKSTIDLRKIIDNKKILLVNLSKGRIGEDRANLLGSMLTTQLFLTALNRQSVAEGKRKDFYLYIDEFHNFTTDSFASILSEARKYRLNLILAHQYIAQLDPVVKSAVFGNVGTLIVFRVGAGDAEALAAEFRPSLAGDEGDYLKQQRNYEVFYKTLADGVEQDPTFTKTMAPLELNGDEAGKETVIKVSKDQCTRARETVEEKINKWFEK